MGGVSMKHQRWTGLVALAAVGLVLATMQLAVVLVLAPALLLFAALVLGYAPGADLIERMRSRRSRGRPVRAPRALPVRRAVRVHRRVSPAASALAMRPPPVALAAIS